jgi:hypothetical protein
MSSENVAVQDANEQQARFETGNLLFSRLFSRWMDMNAWSHPVLVNLARGCMGGVGWLHSSQISGLRHARLRSPGPRTFIAIAELNRCLWHYREHKELIPGSMSSNDYREPYVITEDGLPPSVGWWVEVFCGSRAPKDIALDIHVFNAQGAIATSKAIARYLRKLAAIAGFDPVDDVDQLLNTHYPVRQVERLERVKGLLIGETNLSSDEITEDLPALSTLSSCLGGVSTPEELIDIVKT